MGTFILEYLMNLPIHLFRELILTVGPVAGVTAGTSGDMGFLDRRLWLDREASWRVTGRKLARRKLARRKLPG